MPRINLLPTFARPFLPTAMIAITLGQVLIVSAFAQDTGSLIGTAGEISSSALTLESESGTTQSIRVSASTDYLAVQPGQEDLREARKIEWREIKPGDRLLIKYSRASDGALNALRVICISTTDLEKAQTEQQSDWVRNGTRGVVERIDTAARVIWLRSRSKSSQPQVRIHVGNDATVRHYSVFSLRFDLAEASSFDQIQEGDQLRAKGTLNADHTFLEAALVYFGTFQSIAGTITSVDLPNARLSVKDIKAKRTFTFSFRPNADIRVLPAAVANSVATALHLQSTGSNQDLRDKLDKSAVVHLDALKPGVTILIVASGANHSLLALKILAGIEPIFQSSADASSLITDWALNSTSGPQN